MVVGQFYCLMFIELRVAIPGILTPERDQVGTGIHPGNRIDLTDAPSTLDKD
jgi:hypothetical protein